jgi:BppU N-terminal domain
MAFEIKKGDRRPFFVVPLVDNYGQQDEDAVDLSTATGAVFNMRDKATGTIRVNRGTAQITNPTQGEVTYQWAALDTSVVGTYEAEIEIAWPSGLPETFPNGPTAGTYWEVIITGDIA